MQTRVILNRGSSPVTMDDLGRVLQLLSRKQHEELYDILKNADEYRPEVVDGARKELRYRGLPDQLPKSPEIEWEKITGTRDIPDEAVDASERIRIRRIVDKRHKEGRDTGRSFRPSTVWSGR